MKYFKSKYIGTKNHPFNGFSWAYRNCEVTMSQKGFSCTCMKRMIYKCNHIKSVELGILGVGQTHYELIHS